MKQPLAGVVIALRILLEFCQVDRELWTTSERFLSIFSFNYSGQLYDQRERND